MKVGIKVNSSFKKYLLNWSKTEYVVFGGYGSSKSYNTALKLILKALKEKRKILVVRAVENTLNESCYALLRDVICTYNLEHLFVFKKSPLKIQAVNGSEFIFRGVDKPEKLKSIHGVDIIWIEETAEISYEAFKELQGRLRALDKKNHMLMTFNPVSKKNWVYKHFFKNRSIDEFNLYEVREIETNKTYYHHSTVNDNKFVSDEYKERLEELKTYDSDMYRIAFLGHFGNVGERVFENVEKIEHSKALEMVERVSRNGTGNLFDGLDLGFSFSYNALVRCAVDRDNNTLYIYYEMYNKKLINSELVTQVREVLLNKRYKELIVDSARPEMIEELSRNGIRAYATKKGANSVLEGLQKLKSFKKIYVSDKCKQTYEDLIEFSHEKDRNGEYIENKFNMDSHTIDAIRYALENYIPNRWKGGAR